MAHRVNELLADPDRGTATGQAGRKRAIAEFSWSTVADRTVQPYEHLLP